MYVKTSEIFLHHFHNCHYIILLRTEINWFHQSNAVIKMRNDAAWIISATWNNLRCEIFSYLILKDEYRSQHWIPMLWFKYCTRHLYGFLIHQFIFSQISVKDVVIKTLYIEMFPTFSAYVFDHMVTILFRDKADGISKLYNSYKPIIVGDRIPLCSF